MKTDLLTKDEKALMICCMALASNYYSKLELVTMFDITERQLARLLTEANKAIDSKEVKQMEVLNLPPDMSDLITGGY